MKNMHGIIFAYTAHAKLRELTENRAVSSIPFGGRYRIIDFCLSSMVNAGITDVGVIMRESYQSLLDHLGSGKDWDLSRKRGGLRMLPPFGYAEAKRGDYRGKMEALYSMLSYIRNIRQEYVVVADGDIVANLPLEEILEHHEASGRELTVVCADCSVGEAERAAFLVPGRDGSVEDVFIGRSEVGSLESLGVFIIGRKLLEELVTYCAAHSLYDFERDVLQPGRVSAGVYAFHGYCARIQSTAAYFSRSMDLLRPDVRRRLFPPSLPIRTKVRDEASTYYGADAQVKNCIVADGCSIEGEVTDSILFRGVQIGKGAKVENCIVMQNSFIGPEAHLHYVIADKDVRVNRGRMLMGHETYPIAISKGSVL